jgi:hypothetical protein
MPRHRPVPVGLPGSPERIEVMRGRAERLESLFRPEDPTDEGRENGAAVDWSTQDERPIVRKLSYRRGHNSAS